MMLRVGYRYNDARTHKPPVTPVAVTQMPAFGLFRPLSRPVPIRSLPFALRSVAWVPTVATGSVVRATGDLPVASAPRLCSRCVCAGHRPARPAERGATG
jgi:hypothetical protein